MFRNIITALVGRKAAKELGGGAVGAAAVAAVPFIARRGLGPLGLALGAGWLAKKAYNKYQADHRSYPEEATPTQPVV